MEAWSDGDGDDEHKVPVSNWTELKISYYSHTNALFVRKEKMLW